MLIALDTHLLLKGIEQKKGRKSIEYYTKNLNMLDKKLLTYLNSAYNILHLYGYYDGERDACVVSAGFDNAHVIISKIKPEQEIPIRMIIEALQS
jgi:hypothetical protein